MYTCLIYYIQYQCPHKRSSEFSKHYPLPILLEVVHFLGLVSAGRNKIFIQLPVSLFQSHEDKIKKGVFVGGKGKNYYLLPNFISNLKNTYEQGKRGARTFQRK